MRAIRLAFYTLTLRNTSGWHTQSAHNKRKWIFVFCSVFHCLSRERRQARRELKRERLNSSQKFGKIVLNFQWSARYSPLCCFIISAASLWAGTWKRMAANVCEMLTHSPLLVHFFLAWHEVCSERRTKWIPKPGHRDRDVRHAHLSSNIYFQLIKFCALSSAQMYSLHSLVLSSVIHFSFSLHRVNKCGKHNDKDCTPRRRTHTHGHTCDRW